MDWEKEYEKEFTDASFTWNPDYPLGVKYGKRTNSKMKRFIRKAINQEVTKRLEEKIKTIEGMKKVVQWGMEINQDAVPYNEAIDDVLEVLRK